VWHNCGAFFQSLDTFTHIRTRTWLKDLRQCWLVLPPYLAILTLFMPQKFIDGLNRINYSSCQSDVDPNGTSRLERRLFHFPGLCPTGQHRITHLHDFLQGADILYNNNREFYGCVAYLIFSCTIFPPALFWRRRLRVVSRTRLPAGGVELLRTRRVWRFG
jgi:hypothetical protein